MSRVYVPSSGPDSWRQFLAKPDLHWVTGYSARTVAHAWEAADGFPPEVGQILAEAFGSTELLLAVPEHKTALPGGRRESQSDVFALGRHAAGVVACTIEGKVEEPFGPTVGEWMRDASPGKQERLAYVCDLLGIAHCPPDVHYQLLHRTASALIEAERFCATDAAMLVHSFSPQRRWFEAYERFTELLMPGCPAAEPVVTTTPAGRRLVLGWASGDQAFRLV
ncbi:hypothetical protein NF699_12495 [Sphingomonadaceae bacterium OTU29LAMAA1]|nr:hypothetical protein NF699_12495 [Sphingomonadaceae bacterium OTU29LAMAA1]